MPMRALILTVALLAAQTPALACPEDASAIFDCEAAKGRKFIQLCASADPNDPAPFLQYRFGKLDDSGQQAQVEFEFPARREGSLQQFFGAVYTHAGVYTQSVRFVNGGFSYTVFTTDRGKRGNGVEVRNLSTGKTSTVSCSERPRFYIHELKGLLQCDAQTPAGWACIQ
jgi:hypothetical protein